MSPVYQLPPFDVMPRHDLITVFVNKALATKPKTDPPRGMIWWPEIGPGKLVGDDWVYRLTWTLRTALSPAGGGPE